MLNDLIFAFNATTPIILTVLIGYFLKRIGMMNADFSKAANKLVFRVFLPVMLFMNVYGIEDISGYDFGFAVYAALATIILFLIGIPSVMLVSDKNERRGALMQGIFRSNYALIGIPLATSLFAEEGAAVATLLSAIMVPIFNMLAVVALSIFGTKGKGSIKKVLLGIIKNPLIIGIFAGLLALGIRAIFVHFGISFRINSVPAVWKTLEYLKNLATPLALLVLGAQFEFSAIPHLRREIITGVIIRSILVPLLGLGIAYIAFGTRFGGAEFAALVAVFCTPVAVSSVPMAQEMGADTSLAGQLVVFTTILSALTIFVSSFVLKAVGVF